MLIKTVTAFSERLRVTSYNGRLMFCKICKKLIGDWTLSYHLYKIKI